MSSMVIPIGFGGAGASGGGSFIQVYADAPQYIEGKYLRVSLNGTEIYADSIPTNVDALTLQITEAGTYTIAVYANSSASTAEESHTVLVDSLTASPSVRIGESIYFSEAADTYSYFVPTDTVKESYGPYSGQQGDNTSGYNKEIVSFDMSITGGGVLKFATSATVDGNASSASSNYYFTLTITPPSGNAHSVNMLINTTNPANRSAEIMVLLNVDGTYNVKLTLYTQAGYTCTYSNLYVKVLGEYRSVTLPKAVGISSRGIKSFQWGTISTYGNDKYVLINEVNPNKAIMIRSIVGKDGYFDFKGVEYPTMVRIPQYNNYSTSWAIIEHY